MKGPIVVEVRDRRDDRLLDRRRFEPGMIGEVTFKHEHEVRDVPVGPVTMYSSRRERRADGSPAIELRPFGSPDPEGVYYLGWLSVTQARRIAHALSARFEEV